MSFLSTAVQQVLAQGPFCAVASSTPRGPHCTPLVFAYSGGRVWLTTSRGSVKARAWKIDPGVAGLVRFGELVRLVHRHRARVRRARPEHVGAGRGGRARSPARGAGFSKKNAKFFAGLRVRRAPGAVRVDASGARVRGHRPRRTALLGEDGVQEGRGRWGGEALSHTTFRSTKGTDDPLAPLPSDVRSELGSRGVRRSRSAATEGPSSCRRDGRVDGGSLYAALPAETFGARRRGARCAPSRSRWTTPPRGARGTWSVPWSRAPARSTCWTGWAPARRPRARWPPRSIPEAGALVRIAPARVVWWKGWSSGSLAVA